MDPAQLSAFASLLSATPEERAALRSNPALVNVLDMIDALIASTAAKAAAEAKAKARAPRPPTFLDVAIGDGAALLRFLGLSGDGAPDAVIGAAIKAAGRSGSVTATVGSLRIVLAHDEMITESAFAGRIQEILAGGRKDKDGKVAQSPRACADAALKLVKTARGIPGDAPAVESWRAARRADVDKALASAGTAPASSAPALPGDDDDNDNAE